MSYNTGMGMVVAGQTYRIVGMSGMNPVILSNNSPVVVPYNYGMRLDSKPIPSDLWDPATQQMKAGKIAEKSSSHETHVTTGSALLDAIRRGSTSKVTSLLKQRPTILAVVDALDQGPIDYAARYRRASMIPILAKAGAPLDARDRDGFTSLLKSARRGDLAIVQTLVEAGADADAVSAQETTALHLAASRNHYDIVIYLVETGCNVNATDVRGKTPLHHLMSVDGPQPGISAQQAAAMGMPQMARSGEPDNVTETLKFLLRSGASVIVADKSGQLPYDYARIDSRRDLLLTAMKTQQVSVARGRLPPALPAPVRSRTGSSSRRRRSQAPRAAAAPSSSVGTSSEIAQLKESIARIQGMVGSLMKEVGELKLKGKS